MTARWWTRIDVIAFRHLGVSLGVKALGVSDVLLLRTRGRSSGQVREVLLAYVELDEIPHICAANGGSERTPGWFVNLQDGGPAEMERNGRREAIHPVILDGDERDRVFEAVYHAFPHVRLYLSRTSRTFPVVRLEPLGALRGQSASSRPMVGVTSGVSSSDLRCRVA
jgi:deazaflavin-dependent oxidoreductase (nitroreductase family)